VPSRPDCCATAALPLLSSTPTTTVGLSHLLLPANQLAMAPRVGELAFGMCGECFVSLWREGCTGPIWPDRVRAGFAGASPDAF
jgi:hypothetical protein